MTIWMDDSGWQCGITAHRRGLDELAALLAASDYVVSVLPNTPATRRFFSAVQVWPGPAPHDGGFGTISPGNSGFS